MSKADKLRALKAARDAGTSRDLYREEEVDDIYELVDEDSYRNRKRRELLEDDFVVDDQGVGYVDTGADEWDSKRQYSEPEASGDEDMQPTVKRVKRKQTAVAPISNFFSTDTTETKPKKKIDTSFDDLLGDFEKKTPAKKISPFTRSTPVMRNNLFKNVKQDDSVVDTTMDETFVTALESSPVREPKVDTQSIVKDEIKDESDSDDEIVFTKRARTTAKMDRSANATAKKLDDVIIKDEPLAQYSSPVNSSPLKAGFEKFNESQITEESSFKMFWFDYTEVDNSLLLFGKILTKDGKLVSGMLQVNGLCRELYFLPRKLRESDGSPVEASEIHDEIVPLLLDKYGLDSVRAKVERKKYAFEIPGIPHESDYLKVLLPYQTKKSQRINIPSDLEGDTFYHVFGGSTNIFESFVLQRNIMGPCWLEVTQGNFTALNNTSHCQVEVSVQMPTQITPVNSNELKTPDLNCISIALQTMMNPRENKQEIVSLTFATYKNLPQDSPIPDDLQPNDIVTLVRPIGTNFPPGLAALAKQQNINVRQFQSEKLLLNCFMALLKQADPDVIIGHKLEGVIIDVLLHRMNDLKIPTFSILGRRLRRTWPDKFGKNNFFNREIVSGRLMCDISNEMGQSLTPKCQNWELAEMYEVACKKTRVPLEINFAQQQYQEDANSLVMALKENVTNTLVTADVAFRIQILSLSKQLTNLAGNAWSHTLGGTRAGRNEYILLHEFVRNGYVTPDKEKRQASTTTSEDKKSKYQGGLVFEPEKGLHKNYVLVMDFNSLYPSIIQEFNICFTTVERHDSEELPNVPSSSSTQGVLPRLLATLVSRRREVKKLMKDPKATQVEKAQYDIKQQALKLTANSMYGCLGYVNSRFYAKPLAMLVTNKGREILMNTRQLAESLALNVVYGDTDSVMIDTGSDSFQEAIKIGENFKVLVNERYRLLEIDIDNVFKKLLLHAKKKYAALNASLSPSGVETTTLEVKGLDMKRREYCPLSKEVSTEVLQTILSDLDPETALQEIYQYLEKLTAQVKAYQVRSDKFKINTKLSKDPSSYPGGKNMPAVQVALRLRSQGKVIKAGSVITFVITEASEDDKQSTPAERARPLQELLIKNSPLKPDPSYYLEKQIFAPVERLLERIESFDVVRLAEVLGMEGKRFVNREAGKDVSAALQPLESTISDTERFRATENLLLTCACGVSFPFGGVVASPDYLVTFNGIQCKKCDHTFSTLRLTAQLESCIRQHIQQYYEGWVTCDDATCHLVTKQISVYGRRCLNDGCKGIVRYKYSDKQLYNQLLYFESLFDVEKNKKHLLKPLENAEKPLVSGQVLALAEQNRELFDTCNGVVQKYLSDSGRRFVDMGGLFDFMSR